MMKIKQETFVRHSFALEQDFVVHYYSDINNQELYPHMHEFYEMFILVSGEIIYRTEGINFFLKPGDILFINKNQVHCPVLVNPMIPYERIILDVCPKMLKHLSTEETDLSECFTRDNFRVHHYPQEVQNNIRIITEKLYSILNERKYGNDLLQKAYFVELFVEINRHNNRSIYLFNEETKDAQFMAMVKQYVRENLEKKISISELADYFYISRYHFMREFKRCAGETVYQFILQQKLNEAKAMMESGISFKHLSDQCGFKEYSCFYKAFRNEYGLSPKEYYKSSTSC